MATLPIPQRSRAVLIGTSDFRQADRFSPLPSVRNNLFDLVSALTSADTGILGWEQCIVVDTPDSVSSFMERLRGAVNQAEDLLIVYYAGHGVRHDTKDELYLTVRHTDRDGLAGSAVPFEFVREVLADSPARVKLLILDCCYSGTALGAMSGSGINSRDIAIAGTSVITSTSRNQVSHAPPGERNTAFTGELIALLKRGTSIPGAPLTIRTLYRSLLAAMANRGLPEPKFKSTDTSADLLLRREPQPESDTTPRQPPAADPPPTTHGLPPEETVIRGRAEESDSARRSEPVNAVRVASGLLLIPLWLGVLSGVSGFVGGVVGYFLGTPPPGKTAGDDMNTAIAMLLFGSLCSVVLRWPVASLRAGRRNLTVREAVEVVLMRPLRRLPVAVSVVLLMISLAMSATVFTMPKSTGTSISALSTDVSGTLILLGVSAVFALSIRQRRKHVARTAVP
ncbi:caspase family protein [Saccharothrix obliqua]|uniref:caspase family protein n=1 Tax=Saccharothrix obliqua TaxID=2861747 RepID=UPI001C5DB437|nr:caspase family protein [Saccharothrix obliqua]MBW4722169.1 caspase family protein [Saccharothrix obliqua]